MSCGLKLNATNWCRDYKICVKAVYEGVIDGDKNAVVTVTRNTIRNGASLSQDTIATIPVSTCM